MPSTIEGTSEVMDSALDSPNNEAWKPRKARKIVGNVNELRDVRISAKKNSV